MLCCSSVQLGILEFTGTGKTTNKINSGVNKKVLFPLNFHCTHGWGNERNKYGNVKNERDFQSVRGVFTRSNLWR